MHRQSHRWSRSEEVLNSTEVVSHSKPNRKYIPTYSQKLGTCSDIVYGERNRYFLSDNIVT